MNRLQVFAGVARALLLFSYGCQKKAYLQETLTSGTHKRKTLHQNTPATKCQMMVAADIIVALVMVMAKMAVDYRHATIDSLRFAGVNACCL